MDPFLNPFVPFNNSRPPVLTGRSVALNYALSTAGRLLRGLNGRPMILTGLCGMGKTTLLREIERKVVEQPYLASYIESNDRESLAALLYPEMLKVLRSLLTIEPARKLSLEGLAILKEFSALHHLDVPPMDVIVPSPTEVSPGGILEADLSNLFVVIACAARAAGKGWILLLDEVQTLNDRDWIALRSSLHRITHLELPIMFVGAGLPVLSKRCEEAKFFSENLFRLEELGPLTLEEMEDAITKPLKGTRVSLAPKVLTLLDMITDRIPFIVQQCAFCGWNIGDRQTITVRDMVKAYDEAFYELDKGFFRPHIERLTPQEITFVETMATLGSGPYKIGEIGERMEKNATSIGAVRARIVRKGLIYSPGHGLIAFTVPLFDEFLRRRMQSRRRASGHRPVSKT